MLSQGDTIGHYEILRLLGEGGMGQVYLAQDTVLERNVAIKFLPKEMERDPTTRARFVREAKSAAALDNPFICKVYETGESEEKPFIAMEFVEGKTLNDKLKEEPFALRDALRIALEISEALDAAHKKGIVHRDLKPANIMITPQGHAKVMDFGLAKRVLPGGEQELSQTLTKSSITEQNAIAGTIAYMSPEQARGEEVDVKSDIFSLGIIMHEMLTGGHPFSKPSAIETLSSILRDPPPQTHVKPKSVNPILAPILNKALAKDLGTRYQSATDFAADLRKAQREIAGGPPLTRLLPIFGAGILVVAILVVVLLRFVLPRRAAVPVAGPEPISVLVGDFQNKTGDPVFDDALEQMLGISLEEASFISLYSRAQARELLNKLDPEAGARLNSKNAQLLGRREGINIVVSGWIEPSGKGYAISVWALDPVKSERIGEASNTFKAKTEVLNAAQSLANDLISDLGDIPPESTIALSRETFTAASLEAMKLYAHAQDLAVLGKDEEAIPIYLEAIQKDPNLGRAYAGLAVCYRNRRKDDEANKYYEKSMSLLDQMTDREKFRTRGGYYFLNKNYKQAIQEYSALKEQYPADAAGDTNLPLAYFFTRDMQRALEAGQRAVDRHPGRITPWNNLVWYAMAAGKFDKAEQEVHKILEQNPKFPDAYVCLALIELEKGRPGKAVEAYQKLASFGSYEASWASAGLADFALCEGRLKDAKDVLDKGISFDLENGFKTEAAHKYILLAHALLLQEDKHLAVDAADSAVALSSKDSSILFAAAQIYVNADEEEKAHKLVQALNSLMQSEPQAYARLIEGELSLANGNTAKAIKLFQEAQTFVDTWLGHFALGRAYLEGEEYVEAHSEFELCLKRHGETTAIFLNDLPTYCYFPLVHYYLGRTQEALNSPGARESYQKFLDIKANADPGNPLVTDAQKRIGSQ
jgi:tetratricopeptide (TPR) repeat protein/predicted Ser/Thr protein kinase